MASHAVSLSVWLWALGSGSVREGESVALWELRRPGVALASGAPVLCLEICPRPPPPPHCRSSNEALFRLLSEG